MKSNTAGDQFIERGRAWPNLKGSPKRGGHGWKIQKRGKPKGGHLFKRYLQGGRGGAL